jgi:phage shock protein PspC (stress-responsive transcriptional regulator)
MSKKLFLSDNRYVGGVIAGCAEYFDHDPTIWRLGSIVFLIITGLMPGFLLYFLAWLVMPKRDSGIHEAEYRVINDND